MQSLSKPAAAAPGKGLSCSSSRPFCSLPPRAQVQQRMASKRLRHRSSSQARSCNTLRAAAASGTDETASSDADATRQQHIRVKLRKPMGMILAEGKETVFVEEISAGGNADKSGKVQVGDVITRCSAYVLKSGKEGDYEREGYGKRPYTNWEPIMFDCTGQDFKTVMSAISSNNERWGIFDVTLELRRERTN